MRRALEEAHRARDAGEVPVGAVVVFEGVVVGTHGRTGLGLILMGSVATDVVRKQGLPVILVHADHIVSEEAPSATSPGERIVQGIDRLASGLEGTGI